MPKKKKNKDDSDIESKNKLPQLKKETRGWILSLLSFGSATFFVLAAVNRAGIAGEILHTWLTFLFGVGFFLFPFIFFILGVMFLKPTESKFLLAPTIGSILFFFSGISGIEVIQHGGGLVGSLIASPMLTFFDFYATLVILATLFLIALLLMLNVTPTFTWVSKLVAVLKKERGGPLISELDEGTDKEGADTKEEDGASEQFDQHTKANDEKGAVSEKIPDADDKSKTLGNFFGFKTQHTEPKKMSFEENTRLNEDYAPPPLSLLQTDKGKPGVGDIKANANIIKRTLRNFGINVEMDEISIGPSVTRYSLKPAQGVKLSRIVGLKNDLALALAAHPIRIEAPIPGKSLVGIEIPNTTRTTVGLASLLSRDEFQNSSKPLMISLGRSVTGSPYFGDLAKMPHLLIAGTTGSGKSVAIHNIIVSLLYLNSPSNLRFIMIDPKRVELPLYNKIPHLLTPVITNAKKTILALKWAAREMDRRYDILESESVRDIASYHKNIMNPAYEKEKNRTREGAQNLSLPERMPYIVIVLDELADIMSTYPRELESGIVRLAQMSRAVGIHLILSTQRPSVNVLTGLIKANVSVRMAFQVASQTDSRTILDMGGAETLLGSGDMLYVSGEMSKPVRLQSSFISEPEIKKVVKHLTQGDIEILPNVINFTDTEQQNKNSIFNALEHGETVEEDDLYDEARDTVVKTGKASTTFLQRKLRVGYARAARLMDMLEERGVVGPSMGAKARDILIKDDEAGYGEPETTIQTTTDINEPRP